MDTWRRRQLVVLSVALLIVAATTRASPTTTTTTRTTIFATNDATEFPVSLNTTTATTGVTSAISTTTTTAAPQELHPTTITTITTSSANITENAVTDRSLDSNTNNYGDADQSTEINLDDGAEDAVKAIVADITKECQQQCDNELSLYVDEFGIHCENHDTSSKCFRSRCRKGCDNWWTALKELEPCQEACSAPQFYPYDMPCIAACEMAEHRYWHRQRLLYEPRVQATAPQLLIGGDVNGSDDSQTANSLLLQWNITVPDIYLPSRPYSIQYQYEEAADGSRDWFNLADYNCNEHFDCEIMEGLMPYTSYRFRFELPFGDSSAEILHSPPTAFHRLPAFGAPISRPLITRTLALDQQHVAVFWRAGQFTNGPLKYFKLVLQDSRETMKREQVVEPHIDHYVFSGLAPATNYTVEIAMANEEGESPYTLASVETADLPKHPYDLFQEMNKILIAGEHKLLEMSFDSAVNESKLLFQTETRIQDYAVAMAVKRLYVIDEMGLLYSSSLTEASQPEVIRVLESMDFKPSCLCVDWLNQRLFIGGQFPDGWLIVATDYRGHGARFVATNLTQPITQVEIDPINGWLFYRDATGLSRVDPSETRAAAQLIVATPQLGHFVIDFRRYLVVAYNKSANELYEFSYDGRHTQRTLINVTTNPLEGRLLSFSALPGGTNVIATNGSHVLRQNYHTNEHDIHLIRELTWCSSLTPLIGAQLQPPVPDLPRAAAPTHVQALLTSNMARISWQSPARTPYQSGYAWQRWEYELEILDVASNSAFTIRNIKSTYFNVEKLQANNLYRLRVRCCATRANGGVGGGGDDLAPWSDELLTRSWPWGQHKLLWSSAAGSGDGGLYESDEIGEGVQRVGGPLSGVQQFMQLNGTIFYIDKDNRLQCANIMNPEVPCSFAGPASAQSLAFDWRGGKLYWSDGLRNCVVRSNLDGTRRELLPILDARLIEIDAMRGHLYYSTGSRLVRRSLSGSFQTDEVEFFHVNGFGGRIRGFAVASQQQQLYWIVREHEGRVRLFSCGVEKGQAAAFTTRPLERDIEEGSVRYVPDIESLMWVEANSSRLVFVRTSNLTDFSFIEQPQLLEVRSVMLRNDFIPFTDAGVVPDAVDPASIRINEDGYWDDFNIVWTPISTADNYSVFYKVVLEYNSLRKARLYTEEVTQPSIRITEFHQPELLVNITVTPHTFWSRGPSVSSQLRTPAAAPTQPKRLRVYVQRHDTALQMQPNISALLRWDPPDNVTDESQIAYKVYCWQGDDDLFSESLHNFSNDKPLEAVVANLRDDLTYTFQVQAFAAGRTSGGEKTAYSVLHVKSEAQAVPRVLYVTNDFIGVYDLDLDSHRIVVATSNGVENLAVIGGEERLLWVNENVELISFVPGSTPVKLARMRAEVLALTVDWIRRIVYWAELDGSEEAASTSVSIYALDLCQFEGRVMMGSRLFAASKGKLVKDLVVVPFAQSLLWLEYEAGEANGTVMERHLGGSTSEARLQADSFVRLFEGSRRTEGDSVYLMDARGALCLYQLGREACSPLKTHFEAEAIDDIDSDAGFMYVLRNDSIRAYNGRKYNIEFLVEVLRVKSIKAYSHQPYPPRECLLPDDERLMPAKVFFKPRAVSVGESFIELELPPVNTNPECRLPPPGVKYQLALRNEASDYSKNFTAYERRLNITDLLPYTEYSMQLLTSSYYQEKLDLPPLRSDIIRVLTSAGVPSLPENFTAYALSPTEIQVNWSHPKVWNSDKLYYQLHWEMGPNAQLEGHQQTEDSSLVLGNLLPDEEYSVWLTVFTVASKFNRTSSLRLRTFEMPQPLKLLRGGAFNLTLSWPPTSANVSQVFLVGRRLNDEESFRVDISGNSSIIIVQNLQPKTKYEFSLELLYDGVERPYIWPEVYSQRAVYETNGTVPGAPGQPQIELITGEIFKVFWEAARNNGAPVLEYSLEALQFRSGLKRQRRDAHKPTEMRHGGGGGDDPLMLSTLHWAEEPQPIEDTWMVYCNTTALSCIVRELHTLRLMMFRVRARNEPYGWGPYSVHSERVSEPFVSPQKRDSLILAIIAPAAIVSSCVIALAIVRVVQQRRLKARKLLEKSRPSVWSNLSSVQQQHLMTMRSNRGFSIGSHATMYAGGPLSDADIALMPHISWNQITLLNFLGSGAFGEVYEGLLKHVDEEQPEKVAVKMLRPGPTDFAELLQEAQLMSNFRHENIVRLIGVCCDAVTISIIMEHMEGGDLLSYLRESRPNSTRPLASLQLLDLMTMCIDVATGCCYLEDMHFVHRDLACRNCLVSSRTPSRRTVKIGDFGLARDIYKNDYYRKEGEGLLPVRWMSPESLVDGIFTTQSDVWAFAVLCWEVLTLGQQPYAGRNNYDVLAHVTGGGRLEQPPNCPDKLFTLMQQCWHSEAEMRPSFRKCLNALLSIKADVRRVSLGFKPDDDDYAMYANQNGVVMSTFLGGNPSGGQSASSPLPHYVQHLPAAGQKEPFSDEIKSELQTRLAKIELDMDVVNESDESQLIDKVTSEGVGAAPPTERNVNEHENCYVNEGVSRL